MNDPQNPYASEAAGDNTPIVGELVLPLAAQRPGGLTVVCVVAVVLGVLGVLFGSMSLVQLAFAKQIQQVAGGIGMPNAETRAAQEQMNTELLQRMRPFLAFLITFSLVQVGLAIGLLYGGIRGMKLVALARQVLLWTCAIGIAYEICQLIAFVIMQLQMLPAMEVHMGRVMRASNGNANMERLGTALARFSLIAGMGLQSIWTLLKVGYFWFAVSYLRRPQVRKLFEST